MKFETVTGPDLLAQRWMLSLCDYHETSFALPNAFLIPSFLLVLGVPPR
jgi:hypothetical protein